MAKRDPMLKMTMWYLLTWTELNQNNKLNLVHDRSSVYLDVQCLISLEMIILCPDDHFRCQLVLRNHVLSH